MFIFIYFVFLNVHKFEALLSIKHTFLIFFFVTILKVKE